MAQIPLKEALLLHFCETEHDFHFHVHPDPTWTTRDFAPTHVEQDLSPSTWWHLTGRLSPTGRKPFRNTTAVRIVGALEMAAKPLGTSANFKPAEGDKYPVQDRKKVSNTHMVCVLCVCVPHCWEHLKKIAENKKR